MVDRSEELAATFAKKQRRGLIAALWIAVLTLIEYIVAVALEGQLVWPFLVPLMAGKAWLIMDYFMHFRDLWGTEH